MRVRFRDGIIYLYYHPDAGVLMDLLNGTRLLVNPTGAPELARLATVGLSKSGGQVIPPSLNLAPDLCIESDTLGDEFVMDRLSELCIPFEWMATEEFCYPRSVWKAVIQAHGNRRLFRYDLCQTPLLPESVCRKASLISRMCSERDAVLLVGDDDFMSIALASLGHPVTVVEVDKHLNDVILEQSRRLGLDVEVVTADITQPNKELMRRSFSVIVSEPVSMETPMKAFLSRCISAATPNSLIAVSVEPRFSSRFHALASEAGVDPTAKYGQFCRYYEPSLMLASFTTDLWLLRVGNQSRPWIEPDETLGEELLKCYTRLREHLLFDLFACSRDTITLTDLTSLAQQLLNVGDSSSPEIQFKTIDGGQSFFFSCRDLNSSRSLHIQTSDNCLFIDLFWSTGLPATLDVERILLETFEPDKIAAHRVMRDIPELAQNVRSM